jgi:hypothetical protein
VKKYDLQLLHFFFALNALLFFFALSEVLLERNAHIFFGALELNVRYYFSFLAIRARYPNKKSFLNPPSPPSPQNGKF